MLLVLLLKGREEKGIIFQGFLFQLPLREICFGFFANWKEYERSDCFPFDYEPNGKDYERSDCFPLILNPTELR